MEIASTADGRRVEYMEMGNGAPLVLLGGAMLPAPMMLRFAQPLSEHARVRIIEHPGCRGTLLGSWPETFTLDDIVDAVLAAFPDAPVDLIGHSYGGVLAFRVACRVPERIRSLTLIEPNLFTILETVDEDAYRAVRDLGESFMAKVAAGENEAGFSEWYEYWMGAGTWGKIPAEQRMMLVAGAPALAQGWGVMVAHAFQPSDCDSLSMPTQVLRGEHTVPALVSISDLLAQRIPGAESGVIPKAGHMSLLTHAPQVAEMVRSFITRG